MSDPTAAADLNDAEIDELQDLLAALPAPLAPLDLSALDGFLCGVLLQPEAVPEANWLRHVADAEGRSGPQARAGAGLERAQALVRRRHAFLRDAIAAREWFDPWLFEDEAGAAPGDVVLPWVAGFGLAHQLNTGLRTWRTPQFVEPLALIYQYLDAGDREDDAALNEAIEALAPPATLAEAAQDLVRAVLLLADQSQPRPAAASPRRPDS